MGETRLFVGNLPTNTSEHDLQAEFAHYGSVKSVEIKNKNETEKFAFINLQIEERSLTKCIREFQQHQFKGKYLSVSKAKESFLDRLKREREEAKNPKPAPVTDDYRYEDEGYNQSYAPLPTIDKQVSSDQSSEEEEVEVPKVPVKQTQRKPQLNGDRSTFGMTKAMIDDIKRQESVHKLKSRLDDQKRAIKNALLSIDSTPRNNKIVFEPPEPPAEEEYEKEVEQLQPLSNTSKKRKAQLFDEDENESEMQPESFKVKKQFAGKNGEKLFELQTRFQNDKRFEIDEKFAEAEDTFDARKKYTREELKERKKLRKEIENWDQNELKEERDNQLSILEGITGESTGYVNNSNYTKPAQKGMLRFDPSKKDHLKYLDLVKGDEVTEDIERNDVRHDNQSYEVSEEKFYEVSENLAQSLQQKSDSKPFSIFEMLGVNHEDEPEEEQKPEEAKILSRLPTFHVNQTKFKYDSSDTDEDVESAKEARKKKPLQKKAKGGKYSKSGVWRHNFFVADGDERLKEAFAFIKKPETISSEAFSEKREKLQKVIKSKIRKARSDKRKNEKPLKKRNI